MALRCASHATTRSSGLAAVAALGALAVAGLGAGCGGGGGLSLEPAGDVGQGAGGNVGTGVSQGTGGAPGRVVTCTFSGLPVDEATLSSYTESGITVVSTAGSWQARPSFGNPAPSILFITPAGASATGQVEVTASGSAFSFVSVDLYSSITTIPYGFTGLMGSTKVFSVSGTVSNTFGAFATVANPSSGELIDTLVIELTNGAACCENPMGLDNIRLAM
jgi:hypothetical protein